MMRSLLTVIAGVVGGSFFARLLQWIGGRFVTLPAAAEFEGYQELEAVRAYVAAAPPQFFYLLLAAWAGGALVGGLIAGLVAAHRRELHAMLVGVAQTALAAWQMAMIPHPTWFVVVALTLFVPFAWLGGRLFRDAPDVAR